MKNFSSPRDKRNAYEKKKEKKRKIVQSKLFILELVEVYGIIVTLQSQTVVVVTSPIDGSEDNVESAICWLWVNNSFFLLSFFFFYFFLFFCETQSFKFALENLCLLSRSANICTILFS